SLLVLLSVLISYPSILFFVLFSFIIRLPPSSTLFPYTTLFRSTLTPAACCVAGPARSPPSSPRHAGSPQSLSASCAPTPQTDPRSEEHTSELQSHLNLVCRLLLEKKKKKHNKIIFKIQQTNKIN